MAPNHGLNMHNRITRVNYEPKLYIYDEVLGLNIKWQVSDVHMITKIIEGPFKVKYTENGQIRKKQRYNVVIWPEMVYEPTLEVLDFLRQCEEKGAIQSLIHMDVPPLEKFQKMERKAAELYLKRKTDKGGANPTAANGYTTFKVGELGERQAGKPLKKIGHSFSKIFRRVVKRPLVLHIFEEEEAAAGSWGLRTLNADNIAEVKRCMKLIRKKKDGMYISENWPVILTEADLKNPFWKMLHKVLGFRKLLITTLTCDLDMKDYFDMKKNRKQEASETQEKIRMFTRDGRGL